MARSRGPGHPQVCFAAKLALKLFSILEGTAGSELLSYQNSRANLAEFFARIVPLAVVQLSRRSPEWAGQVRLAIAGKLSGGFIAQWRDRFQRDAARALAAHPRRQLSAPRQAKERPHQAARR